MSNVIAQINEAFDSRIAYAVATDQQNLADTLASEKKEFSKLESICTEYADIVDFSQFAITDKKDTNHIAIKTITKIRRMFESLAFDVCKLDKYTIETLVNARELKTLTNKDISAIIANEIEHTNESLQRLKVVRNASTASAQAPTTRHALRFMKIADYDAQKRETSVNRNAKAYRKIMKLIDSREVA